MTRYGFNFDMFGTLHLKCHGIHFQFRSCKTKRARAIAALKDGKIKVEGGLWSQRKKREQESESARNPIVVITEYTSAEINTMSIDEKLSAVLRNYREYILLKRKYISIFIIMLYFKYFFYRWNPQNE